MALEKQIGARVPATHISIAWMVRHAAYTRIARIIETDGLTAYQRIKGRATSGPKLIGLGETCKFKNTAHEKLRAESSHRWNTGSWMGIDAKTGQHILLDGEQIQHARTIVRLDDGQKWNSERLAKVRPALRDVHAPSRPETFFPEP